jgi:hypothetical protein
VLMHGGRVFAANPLQVSPSPWTLLNSPIESS